MSMYPRDRLLAFLAKIANEPGPDLEPRDWLEYYLDKIAENSGGGGDGGGLKLVDYADLGYSGTVDGHAFNSDIDHLKIIDDNTYPPGAYGFIDSLNAPFALTSSRLLPTIAAYASYPGYFEIIENYHAAGTQGGFYLESADKIIFARESEDSPDDIIVIIVGSFVIGYGGN